MSTKYYLVQMRISYSGTIYDIDSFFPEGLTDFDYDFFLNNGYLKEVHPQNVAKGPETTPLPKSAPVATKSSAKNGSNQSNPEPSTGNA